MRYKGVVQKGKRLATKLGFPTVNIWLEKSDQVSGIFAARVYVGEKMYEAAAYVNRRRHMLEAHLFDFPAQGGSASGRSGDLYGKEIEIELLKKMREDNIFVGTALRVAISDDIAKIREYFTK